MLNKIIHFSLNNRLAVIVGAILLLICGTYTARNMDIDVFPDLNAPTVVVMTEANGMAAEEVERLVTFPIETAVNGATDIRRVRSSSTTGFSVVWVEFDWGCDIYRCRQIVSEKLSTVTETLPKSVGKPVLGPQSSIMGEMMIIGLTSDSTSMLDLRTTAEWTFRPRLLSVGGVAQVAVIGGDDKEYQILLDYNRMNHYGVTLGDVLQATENMNQNVSGGNLYEFGNEYTIRGIISTNKIKDLEKCVVKVKNNTPILISDIADVKIGAKAPKTGVASNNGKPAVLLTITKQPNTNTLELTEKIDKTLAELAKELPADVKMDSQIFRQSRFIESSINNIKNSLFEGGIFVVIVLFIFLMNARTTVISLVTIPLSLLTSILILKFMGLTINTMSIGGMAIAIGSLVDDAIVDVENVFKRLRENNNKREEDRKSIIDVVFEASREVRMPVLNSTLIIIVSFIPLFYLSGMEGKMLAPLGISFIIALVASTLIALTLTPVLCSYLLKNSNKENSNETVISTKLKEFYKKCLFAVLRNSKIAIGATLLLVVVTLLLFTALGRSFLPYFNEGSLTINISTLPGISLEESDNIGRQAEEILMTIPEIQTVARKTGRAELDEHALGINTSEIEAPYILKDRSKNEMVAEIRKKLKVLPGSNIEIGQPISHRIDAMLSGTRANIAIKIFGTDLNNLFQIGNNIKEILKDVEGVADLSVEQQIERPEIHITPKREIIAKYGLSPAEFSKHIKTILAGETVSQVYENNRTFNLVVKYNDETKDNLNKIKSLLIDTPSGKFPLEYLAEVKSALGPNTINRENVERKIVVSANVVDRDLISVVKDIQQHIENDIKLPQDYHIEYGGQFESEQAASKTLLITCMFSILVIFILLYNQFKNATQAAVILVNLPLALIGGVFSIFFTDGIISISSIIGFISLFGIATRNGMLLVDRFNDLRKENYSVTASVIKGSIDRLTPIVMTALTSALALIPLVLFGDLPGNEIQSPMAKVILGGLLSSTLLNGFIVPIMYLIISKKNTEK